MLIQEGCDILRKNNYKDVLADFRIWRQKVYSYFEQLELPLELKAELKVKMHFTENEYSQYDNMNSMKNVVQDVMQFILKCETCFSEDLSENTARNIIEKLLA